MCAGLLFDLSYELNSSMFQYHLKMEAIVKVPMEMEGMKRYNCSPLGPLKLHCEENLCFRNTGH